MRKRSKRYRQDASRVEAGKKYDLTSAVSLVRTLGMARFDATVEVSLLLGVDPKKADQIVRGTVSLPHGIGQERKVIAFAEGDEAEQARQAGAVEAGGDELIAKVQGGWTEFDVAVAVPHMMPKVSKLGRILGPQGKMPSPKSGTVAKDIAQAVKEFAAGKIEYRCDAAGNVHAPVGKVSFEELALNENVKAFMDHIRASRPAAARGQFLRGATLSASMSPGVPLALE